MPRNVSSRARTLIAQSAARLILDHGIGSFREAKKKAARELSLPDAALPGDDEVEAELFTLQSIRGNIAPDATASPSEILSSKRRAALEWMRKLDRFAPLLTGSLAEGWGGEHQPIHLELAAEDAKSVEIALLNLEADFRPHSRASSSSRDGRDSVSLVIDGDEDELIVTIVARHRRRKDRAALNAAEVEKLLDA
jgi:hypothetical protein